MILLITIDDNDNDDTITNTDNIIMLYIHITSIRTTTLLLLPSSPRVGLTIDLGAAPPFPLY